MASATRKNRKGTAPPSEPNPTTKAEPKRPPVAIRAFDAVFRFLASLKLAVICLGSLAAALAYGTIFISNHGQNAANDYVFQTRPFALLLAFLATNVLCAALIRYPWAKRQTGFLITHVGLLMVIGGAWWAFQAADEGLIGMKEGDTSSEVVRTHKQAVFVEPIDPHSGKPLGKYMIPFNPGAWDWPDGKYQVISSPKDPFKLAVRKFYAASIPKTVFVPDPDGTPMIKLRPQILPPGGTEFRDVFRSETDKWFVTGRRGSQRVVRDVGPAQFIFTFSDRHDLFDDFLKPPADPGKQGVARLRYPDKEGKERIVDVRIDDIQPDASVPLPDSDLTAAFSKVVHFPIEDPEQRQQFGFDVLDIVQFKVKRGNGPELEHNGYASMPTLPPLVPKQEGDRAAPQPEPYLLINYYCPPIVDKDINGRFGVIEVMGNDHDQLAYRVFERGNPGKLKSVGLLKTKEEVIAFGGNGTTPMTMKFTVDEFLQGGKREQIAESVEMPINQKDSAMSAILAEMTVGGRTQEVWLRKSSGFDPDYKTLAFGDSLYKVALDSDRVDLGFSITLKDFEVGFDPGTDKASSYESDVRLTDEAEGIKDQKVSIYMNHTFDHKGWRFFQTSFTPLTDDDGRKTGEFVSVFQVSRNPARILVYGGCIVVVLGAFVQFYMRSGVFSDGGKLQHERAEKARRRLEAKSGKVTASAPTPADDSEPL